MAKWGAAVRRTWGPEPFWMRLALLEGWTGPKSWGLAEVAVLPQRIQWVRVGVEVSLWMAPPLLARLAAKEQLVKAGVEEVVWWLAPPLVEAWFPAKAQLM